MKLKETTFDQLKPFQECIFRNEYGEIIHAIKLNNEKIMNRVTGKEFYTGQFHKVLLIEDNFYKLKKDTRFIDKLLYVLKESLFTLIALIIFTSVISFLLDYIFYSNRFCLFAHFLFL